MSSPEVICLGGATVDRKYRGYGPLQLGTSNPTERGVSFGGVARNVCENLLHLGVRAWLATIVGDDEDGNAIIRELKALGSPPTLFVQHPALSTAEYIAALEPGGNLMLGLANMGIFEAFTTHDLDRLWPYFEKTSWVFADCNLPSPVLHELIRRKRSAAFKLAIDPVSVAKARKLPDELLGVDLLILNRDEATSLLDSALAPEALALALQKKGTASVVLTHGAADLFVVEDKSLVHFPPHPAQVHDVTGAGDALIAATIASLLQGASLADAARFGTEISAITVASERTVRNDLAAYTLFRLAYPR